MTPYQQYEVDRAFGTWYGHKRYDPVMPRGATLYRKRAEYGQLYDRGVVRLKSKGRTGAGVRFYIAEAIREGREITLNRKG